MKALVTGGAGFIGSNLANKLHELGWKVDIVDDMSNGHIEFLNVDLRSEKLWQEDFTCYDVLRKVRNKEYDYVFHLAANPSVSYSVEQPVDTHETNVLKTLVLLEACKGNVKRFIFAASSASYGDSDKLPVDENCVDNPKSPYALQKLVIESYLKLYKDLYGLDSACLRFFNVFGPNQLGGSPYSTAISAWLTAIKRGVSMRSDGDGSQSRDMCFVENVVDALIKSAILEDSLNAEVINVGVGESVTNKDILDFLKRKYPSATSHNAPWRPGDIKHTLADITKAKKLIGYSPQFNVWQGLEKTIAWYENNWNWLKNL